MSTASFGATKDSEIRSGQATTNYGTDTGIRFGRQTGRSLNKLRSVLHFDLSSISGATINSATLTLYDSGLDTDQGGVAMTLYRLTQAGWTEGGVTWNTYDGSNSWTAAGGDYDAGSGVACSRVGANDDLVITGLASLVQDALDNRSDQLHVIIRADDETTNTNERYAMASKDNGTPALRPVLDVDYTAGGGGRANFLTLLGVA